MSTCACNWRIKLFDRTGYLSYSIVGGILDPLFCPGTQWMSSLICSLTWLIYLWESVCASLPTPLNCPYVAQWLERLLGVREAGVRSQTASHQRRKNWEVCASQLCAWHQWVRQPTGRLGVSINGRSDSFLLTCGGIESVAWHPKTVRRRSFGPNKTGPHYLTTHTPPNQTCSQWYDHEWLKANYKPDSPTYRCWMGWIFLLAAALYVWQLLVWGYEWAYFQGGRINQWWLW